MLHVFFGTNIIAARTAAQEHIGAREVAGVRVNRIDASMYEAGVLQNALSATSLFNDRELWVIDTPEELAELQTALAAVADEMAVAHSEFVVITGSLPAAEKKAYEKMSATLVEHSATPKPRENTFALTEALARKDKKTLWLLYVEAVRSGKSAEELIGLLWWQLKALRLAAHTRVAEEAGMKDFPYQKAKQALKNFKPGELDSLSTSLLAVYHDGHTGVRDIDLGLESWLLSV